MADSTRIDSVTFVPETGKYHVFFTDGASPLPNGVGPNSLEFADKVALQAFIDESAGAIGTNQRLAIALSKWSKADPQMSNLAGATGRICTIDLTGATTPVTVG